MAHPRRLQILIVAAGLAVAVVPPSFPRAQALRATIRGTVADEKGQPLPGLRMEAYRVANRRMSAVRANSTTDDRGRYAINGLLPGEYVVEALNEASQRSAFHPSGPAPNNAVPVTIEAGEELGGIDIRFS